MYKCKRVNYVDESHIYVYIYAIYIYIYTVYIYKPVKANAYGKNETLLNIVMEPEVQSNVYVERGKNSALERIQRLGEVNSVGGLVDYGYGFFNVIDIK